MLKLYAIIFSSIILIYFSLNLFILAEEHDYQVLKVIDEVEIRKYDEMIYASYTPKNESDRSSSFRVIANYIFGGNSANEEISMTAIGAGAKKIFVYTGDKSKELPDHDHAIDINALSKYIHACHNCFEAMSFSNSEKKEHKINFIQPPTTY